MRIKTSWVALSVAVLSAGLLLVASLEGPLFSDGQPSVVLERSAQPETSASVKPTAPLSTTATPSSAPPAPTVATPSATPAPMPSKQPAPPPAPAAVPSASSGTALPTTPSAPPAPTAAVPSARPSAPLPAAPPAPTTAAPPAPPSPSVLPAEAEMTAADRRQVQEALRRLDYYKGPVDGIFGPLTRAAIRRFQQNIGSDATGYLTADQVNRLVAPR